MCNLDKGSNHSMLIVVRQQYLAKYHSQWMTSQIEEPKKTELPNEVLRLRSSFFVCLADA